MTETRYETLNNLHGRYETAYRPLGSSFINARLDRIGEHLEAHGEILAEAGRYGQHCPFTRDSLNNCLDRVEGLLAEIQDQLIDWDNS